MVELRAALSAAIRFMKRDVPLPMAVPRQSVRLTKLIEALNDAAAAVSAARDISDVLVVVVDAAKRLTRSEKVVLCLHSPVPEDDWLSENSDVVVRGRRAQHPEEWWSAALPALADEVTMTRAPGVRAFEERGAWLLAVPVATHDEPLGVLAVINSIGHNLTGEHTTFLSVLSTFAAAAIANARLAEQSRYALLASERERIAREMHDGLAQSLFSISLGIDLCRRALDRNPALVATRLEEIQAQLHDSMAEVRRYLYDLRPARLRELGLAEALRYWVREIVRDTGPSVTIVVDGDGLGLPGEIEACLYHIAREALTNAIRHSGAGRIVVEVLTTDSTAAIAVSDDGDGFFPLAGESDTSPTHGLRTMRERAEALGGQLRIESEPGKGCRVLALIPLGEEGAR